MQLFIVYEKHPMHCFESLKTAYRRGMPRLYSLTTTV